ncbi:MAG: hypothetical protein EOO42_02700 [Flavobacteriales bacterium]|nr:MAG: hypothetical protein EOO42_02700 [Flavobacteriales bacterium]
MENQLLIGILAGSLTAISATPQIIKVLRTKEVAHISPFMFIILALGNATWCYYGILLKDWPIIITNAFSLIMDILMLILKVVYRER